MGAQEVRLVPTMTLADVLGGLLGGQMVKFLKIDAQGADLLVVRSAGQWRHNLQQLLMEVVGDNQQLLYDGSMHCSAAVSQMVAQGFCPLGPSTTQWANGAWDKCHEYEHDQVFVQAGCCVQTNIGNGTTWQCVSSEHCDCRLPRMMTPPRGKEPTPAAANGPCAHLHGVQRQRCKQLLRRGHPHPHTAPQRSVPSSQ